MITLIAFGKLRTPGLRETAAHYADRLRAFEKFELIELKPEDSAELEHERFLKTLQNLGSRIHLTLCDERGKGRSSTEWAQELAEIKSRGVSHRVFGIGSSWGWSADTRKLANTLLSFGPQTTTHELARIFLLEHLYRIECIDRKHPYHHTSKNG